MANVQDSDWQASDALDGPLRQVGYWLKQIIRTVKPVYERNLCFFQTRGSFFHLFFQNVVQSSGNILVIHRVTNATSGIYTCIATNDAGTSQANIQLKVKYG